MFDVGRVRRHTVRRFDFFVGGGGFCRGNPFFNFGFVVVIARKRNGVGYVGKSRGRAKCGWRLGV